MDSETGHFASRDRPGSPPPALACLTLRLPQKRPAVAIFPRPGAKIAPPGNSLMTEPRPPPETPFHESPCHKALYRLRNRFFSLSDSGQHHQDRHHQRSSNGGSGGGAPAGLFDRCHGTHSKRNQGTALRLSYTRADLDQSSKGEAGFVFEPPRHFCRSRDTSAISLVLAIMTARRTDASDGRLVCSRRCRFIAMTSREREGRILRRSWATFAT